MSLEEIMNKKLTKREFLGNLGRMGLSIIGAYVGLNLLPDELEAKGYSADYPEIGNLNKYRVGDIVKIGNIKFRVGEKTFNDPLNIYRNPLYKYDPKTLGENYRYLKMLHPERHIKEVFWEDWYEKYLSGSKGSMIMIFDPNSFWVRKRLKEGRDLIEGEYNFMFYAQEKAKERFGEFFRLYVINIDNFTSEQKMYLIEQLKIDKYKKYKTIVSPTLILIKNNGYADIRAPPLYDEGIDLINEMFDLISK